MKRGKFEADNRNVEVKSVPLSFAGNLLLYIHDLVFLFGIVMLALLLCLRVVVVSGTSMNNTLLDGDYVLLLNSTFYTNPKYGDIIVASKDQFRGGEPIIKRVIAVEGQSVDIDFLTGTVYVDGNALTEDYISSPTTMDEGVSFPLVVDEGCVFVMGDNRDRSQDSRSPSIGLVDCREILGKAIFLFFPGTNKNEVPRDFTRLGGLS